MGCWWDVDSNGVVVVDGGGGGGGDDVGLLLGHCVGFDWYIVARIFIC